jgi:hypothetical protein
MRQYFISRIYEYWIDNEAGFKITLSSLQQDAKISYAISIKNIVSYTPMEDIVKIVVRSGMRHISMT